MLADGRWDLTWRLKGQKQKTKYLSPHTRVQFILAFINVRSLS